MGTGQLAGEVSALLLGPRLPPRREGVAVTGHGSSCRTSAGASTQTTRLRNGRITAAAAPTPSTTISGRGSEADRAAGPFRSQSQPEADASRPSRRAASMSATRPGESRRARASRGTGLRDGAPRCRAMRASRPPDRSCRRRWDRRSRSPVLAPQAGCRCWAAAVMAVAIASYDMRPVWQPGCVSLSSRPYPESMRRRVRAGTVAVLAGGHARRRRLQRCPRRRLRRRPRRRPPHPPPRPQPELSRRRRPRSRRRRPSPRRCPCRRTRTDRRSRPPGGGPPPWRERSTTTIATWAGSFADDRPRPRRPAAAVQQRVQPVLPRPGAVHAHVAVTVQGQPSDHRDLPGVVRFQPSQGHHHGRRASRRPGAHHVHPQGESWKIDELQSRPGSCAKVKVDDLTDPVVRRRQCARRHTRSLGTGPVPLGVHGDQPLLLAPRQATTVGPSRDVAQLGSASALGAEGRRFESCHPDQFPSGCSLVRDWNLAVSALSAAPTRPRTSSSSRSPVT